MSDKKGTEKEKVVTKYDRKMQRRQEEKEREKREKMIGRITGCVILAALVIMIAYFPIKSYAASKEIYVTVGGEDISRVEFDYNYYNTINNYITQYQSYLGYMGFDRNMDFSTEMYSDTMTWQDYFQEMTVNDLKKTKAMKAAAKAAGFTYDGTKEVTQFKDRMKKSASEAKLSTGKYLKQTYGPYATLNGISKCYEEAAYINAYYKQVSDSKAATDEEINTYYDENKSNYDSVDYYVTTIEAELPTEPTELADPETDEDEDGDEDGEYEPSDAEVEKAMADAMVLAEAAKSTVKQDGEHKINEKKSSMDYLITDWLFDESRREGEVTIIEDSYSNSYYVLSFEKRYRDEAPTANMRVIMVKEKSPQDILNEWKAGAATEDSFAELCEKYTEAGTATGEGGLIENVAKDTLTEEIDTWLFEEGRVAGDTTVITPQEGYSFVLYYVGQGDPEWKSSIASTLLNKTMNEYVDELTETITVEDKHNKMKYIKIREEEEASKAAEEASKEAEENAEDSGDVDVDFDDAGDAGEEE